MTNATTRQAAVSHGVIGERMCAELDREMVLFLIGMRLNRPWKLWRWLPVARAMPRMQAELAARPELGLLHARNHGGLRNFLSVQYWRSLEDLLAFAKAPDLTHLPAWRAFYRRLDSSADVGIWHETYLIGPGRQEAIYVGMPPFGLGRVGRLEPARGHRAGALTRMRHAVLIHPE